MKRMILIFFAVLLALAFTVGAEAKNGEREKKFRKMFPVPQAPQNNNSNNNTYNYYYYNNNDYYYDRGYRGDYYYYNDRCGWIPMYRYDRYGRVIEYQKYHCQGERD